MKFKFEDFNKKTEESKVILDSMANSVGNDVVIQEKIDVHALTAAAFAEGKQVALQEMESMREGLDNQRIILLQQIAQNIDKARKDFEEMIESMLQDCALLAYNIAVKISANVNHEGLCQEIFQVLRDCVAKNKQAHIMKVMVHSSIVKELRSALEGFQHSEIIEIIEDENILPGDCKIKYDHHCITRNKSLILEEIEKMALPNKYRREIE